ncbi:unnamed protein product [Orchesella dallaii]|uniref:Uncharacterized protein n=1 Tax=Orchesella dallaii TaxID=48710 RepID=A0ABP1QZT4_9HEXA
MSMNLLVFVLLGISAITSYQASSVSTNKSTGIIFDLTQQIKALRQGSVLKEDLKRTVSSGTCLHVSEVKDRFYYNIENSSDIDAHTIKQVFQVLNDVAKVTGSFQLTISLPFDYFTISNDRAGDVDNIQSNPIYVYNTDSQLNIVIDLNIDMICDDDNYDWEKWLKLDFLRTALGISEIQSMILGISLNSSKVDLNCTKNILSKLKGSDVTFIVYNDELKDKTDLEDSLNYLIKDVVPRLQGMFPLKQVIYNPNLDEIDESNCRLLSLFSELYEINIISHIPELVYKTINSQDFFVIPHLSSDSFRPIDSFRYKNIWTKMLPFVVDAVSKGFQTFVVTPSEICTIAYDNKH